VHVQLKGPWLATSATDSDGEAPGLRVIEDPRTKEQAPMQLPFIVGDVIESGALRIDTGNEGQIEVAISPDVIHSVSVQTKPFVERRIATPDNGGIVLPGQA